MSLDDVRAYLLADFPQAFCAQRLEVVAAAAGRATLRLSPDGQHLRPGGIVSGPTFMMLADAGAYAALLSLGAGAKMAVTTNLNVTFLRAGRAEAPIRQEAAVIRAGRRLATIVTEAFDPADALLAHATMTYAMPAQA